MRTWFEAIHVTWQDAGNQGGVEEEAVANWSKLDFSLIHVGLLITYFITVSLPMNPQAQLRSL